jgi:hypothetical protein
MCLLTRDETDGNCHLSKMGLSTIFIGLIDLDIVRLWGAVPSFLEAVFNVEHTSKLIELIDRLQALLCSSYHMTEIGKNPTTIAIQPEPNLSQVRKS